MKWFSFEVNVAPENRIIFLLSIMIFCFAMQSCKPSGKTIRKITSEHYFSIETDTILQSLGRGSNNTFTSIDSDKEAIASYSYPINWTQADYLLVVDKLHEHVWGESVYDWKLNHVIFSLGCNEVSNGFQMANFSFFREITSLGGFSVIEHNIDVYPSMGLISAREYIYDPGWGRWKSVDLTTIAYSADDALLIAENAGGSNEHVTVNDMCKIILSLTPNSPGYRGWDVSYVPNDFSISVDPITGQQVR